MKIKKRISLLKSALFDQHPELRYRESILRLEAGGSYPMESDYGQNSRYYKIETWVQKAVRVWKDNIADKRIVIVEDTNDGTEIVNDHPYGNLLANPNEQMSASDLWSEWAVSMGLGGEHGLEFVKGSISGYLEIYPTAPSEFYVDPMRGNEGRRYRKVSKYRINPGGIDTTAYDLDPDEFLHFRFFNPLNQWRGIAPITAARMSIKLDLYSSGWPLGFYERGARPDFALIAPEGLTAAERDEYKTKLLQDHGYENRFEPIILESGVTDIKTFSFAPADLAWLEHKKVSRDEIGAIFGIPDGIMGWGQESYDTQTKLDGDTRALWVITLEPIIGFRDDGLTRFGRRIGMLKSNQRAMTDLSSVAVLQDDISGKVAMLDTLAARGYPVNVAADFLSLGIEHIPGGDTGYLPFSLVPVDVIGTGNGNGKAIEIKATKTAPAYGSKQHEAIYKRKQQRADRFVDQMKRELKRYFQDQQNEISRNARESRDLGRGQYKESGDIPPIDRLFDVSKWNLEFTDRFDNIIRLTVFSIGQGEIDNMNALGADLSDFEGSPEVEQAIREILNEYAKKINDSTYSDLIDIFSEAESQGESIPAIMERLSAFFGDRKSDWQVERIARTTITSAANSADLLAWAQSEVVRSKTWISALIPKRTRSEHADAHGQTVRLNENFHVGGESLRHPGDPQGSPGNIINCLCTQIGEVEI